MSTTLYERLAPYYHLLFADWDAAMRRQGRVLAGLLPAPAAAGPVLDCASGIGTQSLALAALGYAVEGSDLCEAAIARAQLEARGRGLDVPYRRDDFRSLDTAPRAQYGAVLALDNSLPHLDSADELVAALAAMRARLRPGGRLLLSLRDYEHHLAARPTRLAPAIYPEIDGVRIVTQEWDWLDERRYAFRLAISRQQDGGGERHVFTGQYRAVTPRELAALAETAGLADVRIIAAGESGYYQPIVSARAP